LPPTSQLKIDQFLISSAHLYHPGLRPDAAIVAVLTGNMILLLAKIGFAFDSAGCRHVGFNFNESGIRSVLRYAHAGLFYIGLRGLDARDRHG